MELNTLDLRFFFLFYYYYFVFCHCVAILSGYIEFYIHITKTQYKTIIQTVKYILKLYKFFFLKMYFALYIPCYFLFFHWYGW